MSKKSGFTLIELLITVAIIAVLSAFGLVIYSSVMKQGRDSKRISDLRSMQSALEQYYADQMYYPYTLWFEGNNCGLDHLFSNLPNEQWCQPFTNRTGNAIPNVGITKTYINSVPQNPAGNLRYKYVALPNDFLPCNNSTIMCTGYCLYAKLENPVSGFVMPASCTLGEYNYALTPP